MDNKKVEQVRKKEQDKVLKTHKQYLSDLGTVLNTPAGKRVIVKLLEHAGLFSQTFVPGEPDRTALNEGKRLFGLWLLQDLTVVAPELFNMPIVKCKPE